MADDLRRAIVEVLKAVPEGSPIEIYEVVHRVRLIRPEAGPKEIMHLVINDFSVLNSAEF